MTSGISWSNLAKDFQVGEIEIAKGITVIAYTPRTRAYAMTEGCIGKLFSLTTTHLITTARAGLKKTAEKLEIIPNNFLIPLEKIKETINESTFIFLGTGNLIGKEKTDQKSDTPSIDAPPEKPANKPFGLEPDQQIACIKRASQFVIDWFQSKSEEYTNGDKQVKIYSLPTKAVLCTDFTQDPMMHCFFLQKLGCLRADAPVAFTAQDLENFGIAPGEKTAGATKMNCAEFAL